MRKVVLRSLIFLMASQLSGQLVKSKSIDASIGYGLSIPYDIVATGGSGFYLQGEYVMTLASWIDLRPYAGIILTKGDGNPPNTPDYTATANAFMLGGKTRLTAPIPYVAPYIEFGIGASLGTFRTFSLLTDIDKSGLLFHIPASLGLELGANHNFDLAFTYYFHPSADQYAGAVAIGISFPLKK